MHRLDTAGFRVLSCLFVLFLHRLGRLFARAAIAACLTGALPSPLAASERFPLYPAIQTNVAFWEDIYGRYTTRQAVLHDSMHLGRIYGVVELVEPDLPLADRINSLRITLVKDKLAALFDALAAGTAPRTPEERRIAQYFAGRPRAAYRSAKENLRAQLGQKDRFQAGVVRSGRYLPYIRSVLAEEGLPAELAYLPHVESSFNPKAGSKAGATGLWQFTRSTGKQYMTINSLVDERFDPYISTRAAARLLKKNHEVLGNWSLAITAYNYGRAGMVRAVQTHGSYEAVFRHYTQGHFKFASRNFYPEFLAAIRVAKRMERSGLVMEQPEATRTYRLKEETALGKLSARHGLDRGSFIRLNPALQTPVLSGARKVPANFLVRIPAGKQGKALQQQAKKAVAPTPGQSLSPPPAPRPQPQADRGREEVVRYFRYTVVQGDTLSDIARRFGVSRESILRANNKGPHNPIRVGDQLVVPVKGYQ